MTPKFTLKIPVRRFILPTGLKGAGDAKYTLVVSMLSMGLVRIGLGYLLGVTFKSGGKT